MSWKSIQEDRTFPFVAKATGVPLARIARVALGEKLSSLDIPKPQSEAVSVKAPVFPFIKLRGSIQLQGQR